VAAGIGLGLGAKYDDSLCRRLRQRGEHVLASLRPSKVLPQARQVMLIGLAFVYNFCVHFYLHF
jgi:hypothetical protein